MVSYDVDGAREVVITGETGFLVPPRDAAVLAEKLKLLAADPACAHAWARRAAAA